MVKKIKKVAHIILKNGSKFLFQLRDNKKSIPFPGYWGLIGGSIEKKESPLEAITREIKEEVDCEVSNIVFLNTIPHYSRKYKRFCEIYLFRGDVSKKISQINLYEGQKLGYFSFHQLKDAKIVPDIKNYILENCDILS